MSEVQPRGSVVRSKSGTQGFGVPVMTDGSFAQSTSTWSAARPRMRDTSLERWDGCDSDLAVSFNTKSLLSNLRSHRQMDDIKYASEVRISCVNGSRTVNTGPALGLRVMDMHRAE